MTEAPAMPAYMRRHGEFDPDPSTIPMYSAGKSTNRTHRATPGDRLDDGPQVL
jgi:hypothetical protein